MFQDKRNLLDLYNAINGTNHQDPEELEIAMLHILLTEFDEKICQVHVRGRPSIRIRRGRESGYENVLKIIGILSLHKL